MSHHQSIASRIITRKKYYITFYISIYLLSLSFSNYTVRCRCSRDQIQHRQKWVSIRKTLAEYIPTQTKPMNSFLPFLPLPSLPIFTARQQTKTHHRTLLQNGKKESPSQNFYNAFINDMGIIDELRPGYCVTTVC